MIIRHRLADLAVFVLAVAVDVIVWSGDQGLRDGSLVPWGLVPALVVGIHLSLFWRRSNPVLVFAIQWAFALISLVIPQFQPFAGLLVALHAVSGGVAAAGSVAALAATIVPFTVHSFNSAAGVSGSADAMDMVQLVILWMALAGAVWVVGRLTYVSAVRAARQRESEAREAVVEERARLARELHDTVSHAVTSMMIQAAGGRAQLERDPARARAALEVIERSGLEAMTELRRMLGLLTAAEATASPAPSVADIDGLVRLARAGGHTIGLTETGTRVALAEEAGVAAYRIVQESLTNSMKYAGSEATVMVGLRWSEQALDIDVQDRRSGPTMPDRPIAGSSGYGIAGLRTRVERLGGSVTAGPDGDGYRISARLPALELPRP